MSKDATGASETRYIGTFISRMDLEDFPFDEQTLSIELESPIEDADQGHSSGGPYFRTMLILRRAQLDAMARELLRDFRGWMLEHLREHFAPQLEQKSDDELRALVDEGLRRGRAFGLDRRDSLCSFIDLAVLFGLGFEHDRGHTWVARALDDLQAATPDDRVALMTRYAVEWLDDAPPTSESLRG